MTVPLVDMESFFFTRYEENATRVLLFSLGAVAATKPVGCVVAAGDGVGEAAGACVGVAGSGSFTRSDGAGLDVDARGDRGVVGCGGAGSAVPALASATIAAATGFAAR